MFVRKWIWRGVLALLLLSQLFFWGFAPAFAQGDTPTPPPKPTPTAKTQTQTSEAESARQGTPAPAAIPAGARMPDLRMLRSESVSLDTSRKDGSRLLRFTTSIINAGLGPAELRGEKTGEGDNFRVNQVITIGEDETIQVPLTGTFYYNNSHSHYHWEGFAAYEVWTVETSGALGRRMVSNDKVGFCLFDSYRIGRAWLAENVAQELPIPPNTQYANCRFNRQGLSPGWVDVYRHTLEGQALDITDLADGAYALRTTVNPYGVVHEASLDNNSTLLYFALHKNRLILLGPQFDLIDYFSKLVDNGVVRMVDGKVEKRE